MKGSLAIVGTGIQVGGHLTLAGQAWIKQADKVVFMVADPVMAQWLIQLNPTAEPLPTRGSHTHRKQMYRDVVARIIELVEQGLRVCAVYYGHPGVFVDSARQAVQRARELGYSATMLPGISAEDCLFADLLLDPGTVGCQSFEATDFLIRHRRFDPYSALILWQVSMIGVQGFFEGEIAREGLCYLRDELIKTYGLSHRVTLYEASVYPTHPASIHECCLADLGEAPFGACATMYVPALGEGLLDLEVMTRLGMSTKGLAEKGKAGTWDEATQAWIVPDLKQRAEAWFKRAGARLAATAYDEALSAFNEGLQLNPNSAWGYAYRGECQRLRGCYRDALRDFNRSLELDPNSAWAWAHRGSVQRMLYQFDEAIADFNQALALKPDYIWAIGYRALIQEFQGSYAACLENFDPISDQCNLFPDRFGERAMLLCQLGRYEDAIDWAKQAVEKDPDRLLAHYTLATVASRAGAQALAETAIAEAEAAWRGPGEHTGTALQKYRLAGLAAMKDETAEALAGLNEALAMEPRILEYYLNDPTWKELKQDASFRSQVPDLTWLKEQMAKQDPSPT